MALRQCQHILRISPFLLVDNDVTFIGTSLTHPITLRHLCQFRLKTIQMKTTITHVTKYHVVLSPSILANPANSGRTQGFFSIVARCLHRDHEIEIFDGRPPDLTGLTVTAARLARPKKFRLINQLGFRLLQDPRDVGLNALVLPPSSRLAVRELSKGLIRTHP